MKSKLRSLAKDLAINYFNVSVASKNPFKCITTDDNIEIDIDAISVIKRRAAKVFKDDLSDDDFKFSRNIMIIGNGASMNAFNFMDSANRVINYIERELKFNIPSNENTLAKYRELASQYFKKIFSQHTRHEEIQEQLGFEGRLSMLHHFYTEEIIQQQLKNYIDFKYLPNLFYEIVAHMFKHRFIDVVINMNFDELQDNAIEDEIGSCMIHKICSEADIKDLRSMTDDNRLRVPIYIKPHGTGANKKSMLYTKDHYIQMPFAMKQLLNDIVIGKVSDKETNIKKLNIIIAGYKLGDDDILDVILSRLGSYSIDGKDTVKVYIIDKFPESVITSFVNKIKAYQNELQSYINSYQQRKQELFELINSATLSPYERDAIFNNITLFAKKIDEFSIIIKNTENFLRKRPGKSSTTDIQYKNIVPINVTAEHDMGWHMEKLYENIAKLFKDPFEPVSLIRHQVLTKLFPRQYFERNFSGKKQFHLHNFSSYITRRVLFEAIYEALKHKGNIPLDAVLSNRTAKYHQILQVLSIEDGDLEHNIRKNYQLLDILDILNDYVKVVEFKHVGAYINCPWNQEVEENIKEKLISLSVGHIYENINFEETIKDLTHGPDNEVTSGYARMKDQYEQQRKKAHDALEILLNKKINCHKEIQSNYFDKRHKIFRKVNSDFVINTNLALTLRYREMMEAEDWTTHLMIGDRGKGFNNACITHTGELSNIINFDNKILRFIITNRKDNIVQEVLDRFDVNSEVKIKWRDQSKCLDHMVLFLKKDLILRGIYFYRDPHNNSINPIWFNNEHGENHQKNLRTAYQIFKDMWADSESELL